MKISTLLFSNLLFSAIVFSAAAAAAGAQSNVTGVAPVSRQDAVAARDAYVLGAKLLNRGEVVGAEQQFTKALALDPTNPDYSRAALLAREHHLTLLVQEAGKERLLGHGREADNLLAQARELDPENSIVTQHGQAGAAASARMVIDASGDRSGQNRPEASAVVGAIAGSTRPVWMEEPPTLAGPITLAPGASRQSFNLHADTQSVVRQVFTSYGIRPVFDSSIPGQDVRFALQDTTYDEAAPILLEMASLFAVPLDAHSVLIAKDTPVNRQRFERLLEETVYVPGMTPDEMRVLGELLRNVFEIKQVSVQSTGNTLLVRAPTETLTAVNRTLADLVDSNNEVMIELRLFSVDRTRDRNIGLQLPQQFGVYSVGSAAQQLVSANQTLVNQAIAQGLIPPNASTITIALYLIGSGLVPSSLLTNTLGFFGGGLTLAGVTAIGTTSFNLALNSSDTKALDDVQIRVGDRQTTTFRAGSRYPITTSTYTSGSAANASSLAGVSINGVSASSLLNQYLGSRSTFTVPQIQYEDLGLTLKATPNVQRSNRVIMHLDLKIEALTGAALDNIPVLASRQFVSDITVADGETALMTSTLTRSETRAVSGVPGLGELPGFSDIAADKNTERDTGELVLLVTPHIIRHRTATGSGPRIAFNRGQASPE